MKERNECDGPEPKEWTGAEPLRRELRAQGLLFLIYVLAAMLLIFAAGEALLK
jgi:hypothetical protein